MADREKVIKGLNNIGREIVNTIGHGEAVPYLRTIDDVLAMLKEQEPKQVDLYGNDEWWGLVCVCPDCNAEWMTDKANAHFCPNCGKPVKWE